MESKYQKYYDALKGKDFSSPISKYSAALSNAKTKVNSAETIINSSQWIEKGLEIIKGSVLPSLKEQETQLETGITALTNAVSKIGSLVSKLEELEQACSDYNNCEDEEKKPSYRDKVSSCESACDSLISEINGISFEFKDTKSAFSTIITELKDSTDIAARKAAFLGSLDDNSWYIDPAYATKAKELLLFDNTTGEILKEGDLLNMKVGETRILTVRLPHNAGRVKQLIRTTAWQPSGSNVVSTRSDLNPDPNVVE